MLSLRKKIGFGFLSAILLFALIEITGQSLYYAVRHRPFNASLLEMGFSRFTPYGLHEYIPGAQIDLEPLGYPAKKFGIDRYGFVHNGQDRPVQESDFIILLLGGSTVEGRGASSNQTTAAAFLEKELNQQFPGRSIRVLNGGRSGFIAYQEFSFLTGKLLREFQIDMVIALDGRNDAVNLIQYADHGWKPNWQPYYDEISNRINFLMKRGGPTPLDYLSKQIKAHSITASFLSRFLSGPGKEFRYPQEKIPGDAQIRKLQENYFEIHQLAFEACRLKQIPYRVFLQPAMLESKKNLTEKERQIQKDWNRYYKNEIFWPSLERIYADFSARAKDIPYFYDLSGLFSQISEPVYWDSCHYSDKGNQIIAKAMAGALKPEIARLLQE